jgi:predicted O-methyltransferase YrrM
MTSSKAEEVLRSIERRAQGRFLPIIGAAKGQILTEEIRELKPRRILEVGTLVGYSAILMSKDLGDDAEIITIEIHEEEAKEARENLHRAEVRPRVEVIIGNALEVIPQLSGEFDMVFLDAAKDEYLAYLKLAEPKIRKGGIVVADNAGIFATEMKDYLDYVRRSGRYQSRYVPRGGDGVEISTKL